MVVRDWGNGQQFTKGDTWEFLGWREYSGEVDNLILCIW